MAYADAKRYRWHFLLDTKARDGANDMTPANKVLDNTDLDAIVVPAGREVEIQDMRGYVFAAGPASSKIELCKEDSTILCRLDISSTGHVAAIQAASSSAQTFPITVAPQSTSASKLLKLRTDQDTDTDTKVAIDVLVSGL